MSDTETILSILNKVRRYYQNGGAMHQHPGGDTLSVTQAEKALDRLVLDARQETRLGVMDQLISDAPVFGRYTEEDIRAMRRAFVRVHGGRR